MLLNTDIVKIVENLTLFNLNKKGRRRNEGKSGGSKAEYIVKSIDDNVWMRLLGVLDM